MNKIKILFLAIFAELYLALVFVVLSLPMALMSGVMYRSVTFGLLVFACSFLVLLWYFKPTVHDDHDEIVLQKDDPLNVLVRDLCEQLNAPHIHVLALNHEMNASAGTSAGFLNLMGRRRKLVVGIPMLMLLSLGELRAVLAHELGHFSRDHARMGHWVYLVRQKWGVHLLASSHETDGFVEGMQKLLATHFLPYFLRVSEGWSRACEFEADDSAKRVSLHRELISGLSKLQVHDHLAQNGWRLALLKMLHDAPEPPRDVVQSEIDFTKVHGASAFDAALHTAQTKPRRIFNSHPMLQERAQALQVAPVAAAWSEEVAGRVVYSDAWTAHVQQHEETRLRDHAVEWGLRHLELNWLEAESKSPNATALQIAVCEEQLRPSDEAVARLEALVQSTYAHDPYAHYELGRALLQRDRPACLVHFQTAMRLDKRYAVRALFGIKRFHFQRDSVANISNTMNRLRAAMRWQMVHYGDDFWTRICKEALQPLPESSRTLLERAVQLDGALDACWAGSIPSKSVDGVAFTIHVVVIRIKTDHIRNEHHTEIRVENRIRSVVSSACMPHELVHVETFFTTEAVVPHLLENLQRHPDLCLKQAEVSLNPNKA